jgi:hypothetical protein
MLVAERPWVKYDGAEHSADSNGAVPHKSRTTPLGMPETGGERVDLTSIHPEPVGAPTGAAPKSASPMPTAVTLRSPRTRWSPCHRDGVSPTGW